MATQKNKSKSTRFDWVKSQLAGFFYNRTAAKTYGLIAIILLFAITANVLAYNDSYYALGCDEKEDYVWFHLDKGKFTANSKNLDCYRPKYIPRKDFLQLLEIRKAVKGMKIWDSTLFDRLLSALDKNPSRHWVESVESLERFLPSYVQIFIKLREPYAIIEYKGSSYYLDVDQQLLPIDPNTKLDIPLVRIQGVNTPPPEYGQKWEGEYITDTIGLMKLLQRGLIKDGNLVNLLAITNRIICEPAYARIKGFKKPKITLMLYDVCELVWDIYSEERIADGKAGNKTKLRNLSELIFKGKIEDLKKVKRIDLSSPDSIVTYSGQR